MASQTISTSRHDAPQVHSRLAAASMLLQSVANPPPEPALIFARGRDQSVEVAPIGAGVTVGRGRDATLCLEQCADLSRRHFTVRPESGAWLLEDCGSRNGTMVDGVEGRVTRRLLRDGDIIFAGDLMFLFVNPTD